MQNKLKHIGITLGMALILVLSISLVQAFAAPNASREALLHARIFYLQAHISSTENTISDFRWNITHLNDQIQEWQHEIEGHQYELTETLGK